MIPPSYFHSFCILSLILAVHSPCATAAPIPRAPDEPVCYSYALLSSQATYETYTGPGASESAPGILLRVAKPTDNVAASDSVDSTIGEAGLINSTYTFTTKGKVTFEAEIHTVPGIVSGIRLLGEDFGPEIDLLVSGSHPDQVQTNVFNTPVGEPKQNDLLWENTTFPDNGDASSRYRYAIEWDEEKIAFRVEGIDGGAPSERTVKKDDAPDGSYPDVNQNMRFQLGIWEASDDAGSAGGPVDWAAQEGQDNIRMVIFGVSYECV